MKLCRGRWYSHCCCSTQPSSRPDKEGLLLTAKSYLAKLLCAVVFLSLPGKMSAAADTTPGILNAPDIANLMPATAFFSGQLPSVQARNSCGGKRADAMVV